MYYFIVIILIIFVFIGISVIVKAPGNVRKRVIHNTVVPKMLGVKEELPLEGAVYSLEKAIGQTFSERIKARFLQDNPHVSEKEYDLLFMELQRFFIMCSLLKNVPMFSEDVDEVWHTMIMFTREYDDFSHQFCGEFLHHSPADKVEPDPHGRAWFDLVYSELFQMTDFSSIAWGRFFKNPLDTDLMEELQEKPFEELKKKYFRDNANEDLVFALIERLKKQIAYSTNKENFPNGFKRVRNYTESAPYLTQAMIFYSISDPEDFHFHMQALDPADSKSSSSAGGSCSSGSNDSSCGSSCGSGCGGGGD
ncbi:hypothetical protein [Metabacillus fastidiosus]|uniref:hypothetical protein n=1 Tax=Metabacillus fastidiosus TaxID=1458 RepID=UPI002E22FAE4|nr:hypothetical protein [Metabacillus fastidiosus]